MIEMPKNIIENILVKHPTLIHAHNKLKECYEVAGYSNQPMNLAIVGRERSGKSTIIETFVSKYPRVRELSGMKVPILSFELPAKPTVISLVECMLEKIGDPAYTTGTKGNKIARIKKLIKSAQVRMIVIDEFQHLIDKGTLKIAYEAADWLKGIVNECNVSLVVSGLPNAISVFNRNKQFRGRFNAPIELPIYDWRNADDRQEFASILRSFHTELSKHYECPKFNSQEVAFMFYIATGGRIGYIWKILRQLELNKLNENNGVITLDDVQTAYDESMMVDIHNYEYLEPFSTESKLVVTDDLVDGIIGQGVIADEQIKGNDENLNEKGKLLMKPSARNVLSAS